MDEGKTFVCCQVSNDVCCFSHKCRHKKPHLHDEVCDVEQGRCKRCVSVGVKNEDCLLGATNE
jgi:hypothetical protein